MRKEKIHCLFIHIPKFTSFNSHEVGYVMLMPMGLLAIADCLQRRGYTSRVIHLGLKKIKNPQFSLEDYINSLDVKIIAIPLHWSGQSFDVIETVKRIKLIKPKVITVLGGFTASFFDQEIMSHFENIDFIIRGEGEVPLMKLVQELSKAKPHLADVPNLIWRDENKVIRNKHWYVATTEDMDNLNFTNFGLLEESDLYGRLQERQDFFSEKSMANTKCFCLCIGRGCGTNCTFCGGSKFAQRLVNNRTVPVFRSPSKVLEDIKKVEKNDFDKIFIDFDPYPKRNYFIELFRLIRKAKIDISCVFACWSLPSAQFIDEFSKTFRQDSQIMISPETGSEKLRHFHRGYSYSNQQLFDVLADLYGKRISSQIYFSYPLPYSNKEDIKATNNLKQRIEKKFGKYSRVLIHGLSFDPASKLYCYPNKYRIISKRSNFLDYYQQSNNDSSYSFTEYDEKDFKDLFLPWQKYQHAEECIRGLSQARYALGHYEEALALAKEAVALDNEWGHVTIILNYIRLKKFQEALDEIKVARRKRKERVFLSEVEFLEAQARYALGQYKEALALAKEAAELRPEIEEYEGYSFLAGSCLEKCNKYLEGISELKRAEKANPDEAEINFSLSSCYRKIGQIELANKELDKFFVKFKKLKPASVAVRTFNES